MNKRVFFYPSPGSWLTASRGPPAAAPTAAAAPHPVPARWETGTVAPAATAASGWSAPGRSTAGGTAKSAALTVRLIFIYKKKNG